jgi:hypothetical protein
MEKLIQNIYLLTNLYCIKMRNFFQDTSMIYSLETRTCAVKMVTTRLSFKLLSFELRKEAQNKKQVVLGRERYKGM